MRDTLDLSELVQRGDAFRQAARRRRRRTLAIMGIVVALVVVQRLTIGRQLGALYTINGNAISTQQSPIDPGASRVHTSSDGSVWVESSSCAYLYRYLNGTWTQFTDDDFDRGSGCVQTLALNGAEAWVVSGRDVSHYDGTNWTVYPKVVGQYTDSIVASKWGVAAIDYYGNFSLFDGKQWLTQSVASMLPFFPGGSVDYYPTMQLAPNGDLILAYYGLWRFDGQIWSQVASISEDVATSARLLAIDGDTAWLSTDDGLQSYNLADSLHPFVAQTIEPPSDEQIESIAARNGVVYASTKRGLYRFDGKSWTTVSALNLGGNELGNVAVDPRGTVWAAVYSPSIFDQSFWMIYTFSNVFALILGPFLLVLIVWFFWLRPAARANIAAAKEARPKLKEVLPDLPTISPPATNTQSTPIRSRIYFIGLIALGLLIGFARLPLFALAIIFVVLMIALIAVPRLLRLRQTTDPRERSFLQSTLLFSITYICLMVGCIVLAYFAVRPLVSRLIFDPTLGAGFNIALSLVLGLILLRIIIAAPVLTIYHFPLKRADYDGALNRVNYYLRTFPFYAGLLYVRSFVLTLAGRYDEAAAALKDMIAIFQNTGSLFVSLCLVNLGSCQSALGNHEEALRLIETAIGMYPYYAGQYAILIGFYNTLEIEPERTLELSEVMMHFAVKPRTNLLLGKYDWGQILAERALSLARNNRFDEADQILRRAFSESSKSFVPGVAMLHGTVGRIAALKGDLVKAHEEYNLALQLDPNGAAGKTAAASISSI